MSKNRLEILEPGFLGPMVGMPFIAGGGIPTFSLDLALSTFTAKMAKRAGQGPFAAAPIVQGDWDGSGDGDSVAFVRGNQVSDEFYDNFDAYQGSISFWITPEWAGNDGLDHRIFTTGNFRVGKATGNTLYITITPGGQLSHTVVVSAWAAGTTYHVVFRWDFNNTLDGTNYACISINDAHDFGDAAIGAAQTPGASQYFGSVSDNTLTASAIIEGDTIYRRVLWDGAQGVDAANGDEIALIYAAGAGVKPEQITGTDDICVQVPTNGTEEELSTGIGEAWSWPWSDNELTNWHLQDDTAGAPDNWTNIGAATLADAATADILFGTRSQKITVDAALEGIRGDTTPTPGEDKSVWAWVKTGGANQGVDLRIYDNDGAANIVEMTTDASAWTLFNTCYEVPGGCTDVQHFIESTDADAYAIHVGQVQVLPNLWDDPGMEAGTAITGVGTPTTSEQSAEQAQSAANSWKIIADAADEGFKRAITTTSGKFYLACGWIYADTAGTVDLAVGSQTVTTSGNDSWIRVSQVFIAAGASTDVSFLSNGTQTFYVDDVSIILLDDVSLTVTPANEANATEGDGLRVGGLSTLDQPIPAGKLGARKGKAWFNWTPRHGAGDLEKFGVSNPRICEIYNDNNNYLRLFMETDTNIRFTVKVGGVTTNANWNSTGLIDAGTIYLIEVEYNATQATFSVDGVVRSTSTPGAGIDFGANIPDTAYWGNNNSGGAIGDAVFSSP